MFPEERQLTHFIWLVVTHFPLMLVSIGGIVWAIVNWKKATPAAIAVTAACAVLLLSTCFFPAFSVWGLSAIMRNLRDARLETITWIHRGYWTCGHLCTALCVGALVFAAFAGRAAAQKSKDSPRKKKSKNDEDDDDE